MRILKEAGFNAIRSSHNPMSKAMLAACDRLGMYVMDETFDQWIIHKNPYDYAKEDFEIWWKEDTKAMVLKDYNHPSVVMYSIGNEISELGIPKGQALCGEQAEFVKSLDSTRAVTAGVNIMLATMAAKGKGMYGNGGEDEKENKKGSQSMDNMPTSTFFNMMMNLAGDMMDKMSSGKKSDAATEAAFSRLDISGYNYATSRYEADGGKYPNRIIVGSETLPKKLYTNWKLVEKLPYLIGDFMWTSWDYLGESGGHRHGAVQELQATRERRPDCFRRRWHRGHLRKTTSRGGMGQDYLGTSGHPGHRRGSGHTFRRQGVHLHVEGHGHRGKLVLGRMRRKEDEGRGLFGRRQGGIEGQ